MNRIRDVLRHPLTIMVLLVSVLYIILNYAAIPDDGSTFDQVLFYVIAGVSALSALFMLMRTQWRDWSLLGVGLLGHFIAVAFVYFISVWYQTHSPQTYTHELIVLARSMLIVSGVFVVTGIAKEWFEDMDCDLRCLWKRLRHPRRSFQAWKRKER